MSPPALPGLGSLTQVSGHFKSGWSQEGLYRSNSHSLFRSELEKKQKKQSAHTGEAGWQSAIPDRVLSLRQSVSRPASGWEEQPTIQLREPVSKQSVQGHINAVLFEGYKININNVFLRIITVFTDSFCVNKSETAPCSRSSRNLMFWCHTSNSAIPSTVNHACLWISMIILRIIGWSCRNQDF